MLRIHFLVTKLQQKPYNLFRRNPGNKNFLNLYSTDEVCFSALFSLIIRKVFTIYKTIGLFSYHIIFPISLKQFQYRLN